MEFDLQYVKERIRRIDDYPKKGIVFRDITTLIKDAKGFGMCIGRLSELLNGKEIDYIAGIEARGFVFGSALAYNLNKGFVPVRKKGKLPHETISKEYELEYGSAAVEIHKDSIERGSNVVIADDLLATGGTARAVADLVGEIGGNVVELVFLVELEALNGRSRLSGYDVTSLVKY